NVAFPISFVFHSRGSRQRSVDCFAVVPGGNQIVDPIELRVRPPRNGSSFLRGNLLQAELRSDKKDSTCQAESLHRFQDRFHAFHAQNDIVPSRLFFRSTPSIDSNELQTHRLVQLYSFSCILQQPRLLVTFENHNVVCILVGSQQEVACRVNSKVSRRSSE